jgi:hypothetical protein
MTLKTKLLLAVLSLLCLTTCLGLLYVACQKILSMPFRAANDTLHQRGEVITLDFLIPAGTHIDERMTIGEVVRIRIEKPKGRLTKFVNKVSESIPLTYRLLGTAVLYLFWTFLFLVFFRIFTWMRYVGALCISLLAGALVYFFMPDLILGRADDAAFLGGAIAFALVVRWRSRRRKLKPSHA